jgi:hypothetical protein
MREAKKSSHSYDFRKDFSDVARHGLVNYLRECGYDPNEPPDGLDDCWFTGQEYACGLWRYLKGDQSTLAKSASAYEADLILTRKESGLKEMECGEPDVALLHKMGLGFRSSPTPAPDWYMQIPSVKRADAAHLERERQSDNTTDPVRAPNPATNSAECMFQRIGRLHAKPRDYLIRGFIARNEVGNPFGRPDSFKGVTAGQLVVHIAGGVDFLGMHVRQGPSAYFAAERGEQVKRRIKGHIQRLGLPSDLPCYYGGKPINLLSKSDVEFLIANIRAIEQDAGRPLVFLVIDTQSRTMDGDENSTKDGALYAKAVEAIRQATDAALWIISHTGHGEEAQDRPRGRSLAPTTHFTATRKLMSNAARSKSRLTAMDSGARNSISRSRHTTRAK